MKQGMKLKKIYSDPDESPLILLATQHRYPAAKIEQAC